MGEERSERRTRVSGITFVRECVGVRGGEVNREEGSEILVERKRKARRKRRSVQHPSSSYLPPSHVVVFTAPRLRLEGDDLK